jgi:hypothetical protein
MIGSLRYHAVLRLTAFGSFFFEVYSTFSYLLT